MIKKFLLLILTVVVLVASSCNKKEDPKITTEPRPDDISIFLWAAMFDYYLWYDQVDNLSPYMLQDNDRFYSYLNGFDTDYPALFEDLLYQRGVIDKWSWIIEDWEEQERSFSGISTSMGYDFRLVQFAGSNDIFGYVRYVIPGSPADLAGIERGDLFMEVDGEQLTISNYLFLLFEQASYELSLAYFINANTIGLTGETVSMTSVEIQENPVLVADVIDIGDGLKTAYLVYNAFTSDFDMSLNDAFGDFKSQAVDRLILDMRYNGGGSIRSAVHLASMIYSTDDTKVFAQSNYNDKVQQEYISYYGEDALIDNFTNLLDTTTYNHSPSLPSINNLGLGEVFIITSSGTASASEMIINGLNPYMNVVQVGDTTRGKNVGSFTIKDWYTTNNGSISTAHKWAIQPITLRISNSEGESDYFDGLIPDVAIEEDFRELLPLGNPDEALLAATIDYIMGTAKSSMRSDYEPLRYRVIADSKDFKPFSEEMYIRYPKIKQENPDMFRDFK